MSLELITGMANSGKTGAVLRQAVAAVSAGLSPTLVTPSLEDVRRLEAELSQKAPLGVRVTTVDRLIRDMWSIHGDGRRIVDSFARQSLIALVVAAEAASAFGGSTDTPGFQVMLSALVSRGPGLALAQDGAGDSARVLCQLNDFYHDELARLGLIEQAECVRILSARPPVSDGPVFALRFDTFTPAQISFFRGLSAVNTVVVALTWEAASPSVRANDALVNWLVDCGAAHVALEEPAVASDEIQRLAQALYRGPGALERGDFVQMWLGSGDEAEAALAAHAARDAIACGIAAERVLVVFPNLERRKGGLASALQSAGVPAGFAVRATISETPLGRSLAALIRLASGGGSRADGTEFAHSPFSGLGQDAAQALDHQWRRARIGEGIDLLRGVEKVAPEATKLCIEAAKRAANGSSDASALHDWQELADRLLGLGMVAATESPLQFRREAALAYSAISRTLSDMAHSPITWTVSPNDVLETLSAELVGGSAEERPGQVQVCDLADVGTRRFDVVVLGGMTEAEIHPRRDGGPLEQLVAQGEHPPEPDPVDALRLRFYSLVSRARKRLVLIRQDSDSDARERRPSMLWGDVLDAYRTPGSEFDDNLEDRLVCRRLTRADLPSAVPIFTEGREEQRALAGEATYGRPVRDVLVSDNAQKVAPKDRVFSATEIETYLQCPYRWFFERVVRPEDVDTKLDARELGVHAHGLLAEFYKRLPELGISRVTPETTSQAFALLEQVASSCRQRVPSDGSMAEELAIARAERWVRNVVGQDATFLPGFVPAEIELVFGTDEPFVFAGVRLRGRIDRIDSSERAAFVTDYKSSRAVPGVAKFEKEAKVQAVVYALATEQALGLPICGSVYRSMSGGKLAGYWRKDLLGEMPPGMCPEEGLGEAALRELVERTEERVSRAVLGMRAGEIPREPRVKGACTFCAIRATCEGAVG